MAPPGVHQRFSLTAEPHAVWYNLVSQELHENSATVFLAERSTGFGVLTVI